MPAYVVALIQSIRDPETYKRYVGQVEATLAPFGGRFLARKPDPEALEGAGVPSRAIVLEFKDEATARAWHASEPYQPVMKLRQSASTGTLLLLPGYGTPTPPVGEVCYVEHVSHDVEGTRRVLEATHGWRFSGPDPVVGGAVLATLPNGGRVAVRAPLGAAEKPVTRAYVRVQDVKEAAARAEAAGAAIALGTMELPGHGRIDIVIQGGVEMGLWELP